MGIDPELLVALPRLVEAELSAWESRCAERYPPWGGYKPIGALYSVAASELEESEHSYARWLLEGWTRDMHVYNVDTGGLRFAARDYGSHCAQPTVALIDWLRAGLAPTHVWYGADGHPDNCVPLLTPEAEAELRDVAASYVDEDEPAPSTSTIPPRLPR